MEEKINIIYLEEVKRKKARLKRQVFLKSCFASSSLKNIIILVLILGLVVLCTSIGYKSQHIVNLEPVKKITINLAKTNDLKNKVFLQKVDVGF